MKHATRRCACLASLLAASWAAQAQTFLVVTRERLEGEAALPPLFSQEGFMAAMFDLGYVSFDTGPYEPQVDWEGGDYREPVEIAVAGLADYVVAARIDTRLKGASATAAGGPRPRELESTVRFELLEVADGARRGGGEFSLSTAPADQPEDETAAAEGRQPVGSRPPIGYRQALFRVGEALARECLRLLGLTAPQAPPRR